MKTVPLTRLQTIFMIRLLHKIKTWSSQLVSSTFSNWVTNLVFH